MAIIDVVSWSPQGSRVVYAWKFPETNLATYTQLRANHRKIWTRQAYSQH